MQATCVVIVIYSAIAAIHNNHNNHAARGRGGGCISGQRTYYYSAPHLLIEWNQECKPGTGWAAGRGMEQGNSIELDVIRYFSNQPCN